MDSKVLIAIAAAVIVVGAGCGVYLMMGGEEAKESILSITEPGTYENGTYSKVIISAAVGDGDVTLKGIMILGALIIRGGGDHSVTLEDCTNEGTTTVEKEGGQDVRINLVNTTLPTVQATSNVILEADADSGFTNVTLAGANATVQGNDTKVESVAMGNDTALTVNEGTVVAVDVPAETNATVQAAADGTVQTANVAGNLTVDGAATTIGNVNMQNDSAITVQNGTVENVNIPASSTVSMDVSASGEVQTATVGTGVSINTGDQTDLSGMTIQASEGTEGAVTVNVNDVPTHAHNFVISSVDWEHMDPQTLDVTVTYECDCHDTKQETVTAKMTVLMEPTCTEKGTREYSLPDMPNAVHIVEIDALGHEYYAEFAWTQNNDGSYSAVCSVYCRHEPNSNLHNVDAVVTPATAPASSCTEDVVTTYTAAATYDGSDFTDTKTVTVPKAHKYEVTSVDIMSGEGTSEQDSTIMATLTCTVCSEGTEGHQITERLRVVSSEFVEPSCGQGTPGHLDLVLLYNGEELSYHQDYPAEHTWFFDSVNTVDREHPTMTLRCLYCQGTVEGIEATPVITDRVEPTCTQAGSYKYHAVCTYEGNQYQSFEETVLLQLLGHEYHYEFDWADDHSSAKLIVTCEREGCQFHEEVRAQIEVQTTATCTVAGDTVYTATATFLNEVKQDTMSVNGEPLGHDYHIIDIDWQTLDKNTLKVTVTYECSRCHGTDTGQADVSVRVTDPTCTQEGYRYYYVDGFNGINDIIPASGHDLEYTFQWSDDLLSATLHEECTRQGCDYEHDYQANVVPNTTDPTCTQPGQTVYTATYATEDGVVHSDTRTVTIPAVGHQYVVSEIRWDTTLDRENMTVEVVYECTLCDDETPGHTKTETVAVRSETTPSTCAVPGRIHYYVPDSGDNGYSDELPLGEHTLTHYEGQEATCTEAGWNAYDICSVCGYSTLEVIPALGHNLQHHDAKKATISEVGWEAYDTCSRCDYTTYVEIPMLRGYTVTVFGGLVAEKGNTPTESQITVAENTVVTVKYTGEGLSYWMDDYGDLIPGETFDILVTCDLYVTAHDTVDLVYGDWQTVREPTCTENGLYYRESGEFRQYRTVVATGHQSDYNRVVDTPATCTSEGSGHTVCVKCQEQIPYTIPVAEHSYEYTTQVVGNGSVVGKQIGECTECGHKTIREYISPIYPSGNIVVTFDQYHPNHSVTLSDRDEIHTMWKFTDAQGIERQAYLYQIQLDQFKNGYTTGMDVTTWIFWADYGEHSPVYIARHNQTVPVYGGANNNVSWAVAGYADNLQEYIYLIDKLSVEVTIDGEEYHISLGMDNGRSASALFDLYDAWANVFNAGLSSLYEVGHTNYRGWECTVYSNEDETFYVNEDNCCLYWGREATADRMEIKTIENVAIAPFTNGYCDSNGLPQFSTYYFNNMPTLENSTYFCVKLINGSYNSGDFTMGNGRYNFFNADSRTLVMWIEPTLPDHYMLSDILVLNKLGEWMSVPYVKVDSHYEFNIQDRSINGLYRYMMDLYPDKFVLPNDPAFNGVFIKCVTSKIPYDSSVTVIDGTFRNEAYEYVSEGPVYGGEYIYLRYEDKEDKEFTGINVKVGDGEPQFYSYCTSYEVPAGSSVTIQVVYEDREGQKVQIDFTFTAGGSIDGRSGLYYVGDYAECNAFPGYGYIFVGWFDVTGGLEPAEDNQCGWYSYFGESVRAAAAYKAVFKPIDAALLAEDYTIVLATGGFIHWADTPVYLSALYGSTEYCEDRINTHADPNLEPVHRWDMFSNLELVEGELVNGDKIGPQFPIELDEEFDVKYSGDYTTVKAVFESEVEYYEVTLYDRGEVFQRLDIANDVPYYAPYAPEEREGYNFIGWNTAEDGSDVAYEAGDTVELDGDLILYAQWEAKTFRTRVNVDGLSYRFYNTTSAYVIVTYGQTATIPANLATLYGATLTGWYYMQDEQKVPVASDGTGTIPYGISDIYAVFEYKQYTFTFDKGAEDATGTMQNVSFTIADLEDEISYFSYAFDRNSITFQRPAYNLSKWKFNEDILGTSYSSVPINASTLQRADANENTINLTAVWLSKDYYVKYSKGDIGNGTLQGTLSSSPLMVKADAPLTLNNGTSFSCSGLTFIGWNTAIDGSGRQYAPGESIGLEFILDNYSAGVTTITLYALWAKQSYGITFHGPEGAEYSTASDYYRYSTPNTLPLLSSMGAGFSVDGYTFLYWTEDPQGLYGEHYTDGAIVSALTRTGSLDLYGVWAPNTYTVVFDANGGEGSMENQTFQVNVLQALTANAYSLEGSHFEHWCNVDYNQGAYFEDGEEVRNLCEYGELTDHKLSSTVTLYAIFIPNE